MHLPLNKSTLRSLRPSDAESLARHANNPKVACHLRDCFPSPYAIEDAHQFLESVASSSPATVFAIEVDGVAAGTIGVRLRNDIDRVAAEFGYWLGEEFWGRGIMTEAATAFRDFSLCEYDLTRLEATVFVGNNASARVLEKADFLLETTLRRSAIKNGVVIDRWLYAYVRLPESGSNHC